MTVVLAAAASSSTSWMNLDDLWKIIVLGIEEVTQSPAVAQDVKRVESQP